MMQYLLSALKIGAVALVLTLASGLDAWAQAGGTVIGRVIDTSTNRPLPDVQVVLLGTTRGALTNESGNYRIEGVEPGAYTVRATRIGYDGEQVPVVVAAGETQTVNLTLTTAAVSLDAVVVTATGTQKKRELANAVSNVNADQVVESAPISNISELLTGRAAGVAVLQPSGTSGTGARIRIRGSNSISLSNDPVVFIDGVRVANNASGFSLFTGGQEPSPLNDINPEEIESIEIIKGPSAATLYGTDAANGVIRITTKKGASGRTRWNAWVEQGVLEDVTEYPANYLGLVAGAPADPADLSFGFGCPPSFELLGICDFERVTSFNPLELESTDPFETGYREVYGMSVSGGGEAANYFVSGEVEDEDGVLGLSDEDRVIAEERFGELSESLENPNTVQKLNLRANVGTRPVEDLSINVNTGYTASSIRLPQADNNIFALIGNGLLGFPFPVDQPYIPFGPVEVFAVDTEQEVKRFTGGANANYQPTEWLTARATVGLDIANRYESQLFPVGALEFGSLVNGARESNRIQVENYTGDLGATAQFNLTEDINSRTSVGVQYFADLYRGTFAEGETLVPGTNSLAGAAITESTEATTEAVTLGTFIEQQFGWRDRLYVTGALRADDNSAFGEEFDLIVYPKLGASFVAIDQQDEPFFNVLNSLRLRAAYGSSGLAPGPTDAIQFFNAVTARIGGEEFPGVSFTGIGGGDAGIGNPFLEPERSSEVEVGADLGLFNGRLSMELTYFDKETEDALVERLLAPSLGVAVQRFENLGSVSNSGFEAAINAILLDRPNYNWELNLTGSTLENELLELGEGVDPIIFGRQRFQEGFPLGGYFARPIAFADTNNDGLIGPGEVEVTTDTAVFLGSPFPGKELSVQSQLRLFEVVQLSGLLDYRGDFMVENLTEFFRCAFFICQGLNDPDAPLAEQARAITAFGLTDVVTRAPFIEEGDFWKLRELAVTVFVPQDWARRIGSQRVNISFTGRNLGTWTDYTGLDPELNFAGAGSNFTNIDFLTQPPTRNFTVRLNASF